MVRAKRDDMEEPLSHVESYSHTLEDDVFILRDNVVDLRCDL